MIKVDVLHIATAEKQSSNTITLKLRNAAAKAQNTTAKV